MPFLDASVACSVKVLQNGKWSCPWFAEKLLCIWLESDLQLGILKATEFWLEKAWEFCAELLAYLSEHLIRLTLLQDGMHIILGGVVSRL